MVLQRSVYYAYYVISSHLEYLSSIITSQALGRFGNHVGGVLNSRSIFYAHFVVYIDGLVMTAHCGP